MNTIYRRAFFCAALTFCAALAAPAFGADAYPEKPVKLVVAYAAGGGTDEVARIIAPRLSAVLGQPVFIENRGGAGGTIGEDYVAAAKPDGYTLLIEHTSMVINLSIYPKRRFDPRKDLRPLRQALAQGSFLLVNNGVKANNVQELIALAKANPGKFNFASPSNGSPFRLGMEQFKQLTGTDIVHVPYNGGGVATNAVLGDQAQMIMSGTTGVAFVRAGKLKALATTGSKRSPALPDVPTLAEQGLSNFFMGNSWIGVFAPAGTPDAIANALSAALAKALDDESLRKQMQELNFEVVNQPPAVMGKIIADEIPRYSKFIREAGIKFD